MNITIKYILFAFFSTIFNLGSQYISFLLYDGFYSLYIAMFNGTLAGLILKYLLDKKYIFYYESKNKKDNGKKFFMYSLMGVFTTFIFLGFEISFDYFFQSRNAKYIGGAVGLAIGYIIKYNLDKRFVFKD